LQGLAARRSISAKMYFGGMINARSWRGDGLVKKYVELLRQDGAIAGCDRQRFDANESPEGYRACWPVFGRLRMMSAARPQSNTPSSARSWPFLLLLEPSRHENQ
jgi:hypothetical protein